MATCAMSHLSVKEAFLVVITSARWVSELESMMEDPPYLVFHKDTVFLRLHPKFLPKVVSEFHLNQSIYLPVFFPKPHASPEDKKLHSFNVRCALVCYLQRTRPIRKSLRLFVAMAERSYPQRKFLSGSWDAYLNVIR